MFSYLYLEETRIPCVKAGLISTILSYLESEDPNVVLQALRAIGNISCENGMMFKLKKNIEAEQSKVKKVKIPFEI